MHELKSNPLFSSPVIGIWLLTASLVSGVAHGTEQKADLFELSLEELGRLQVSIASPKRERIIDTPAITSAYEASDMQDLGLNTLEDILNFVPGVVVQDSALGTKAVMIRGIVEAFNQKVLFMLNGVPYWQASHGGIPLLGMPLVYIQRVEIIRGPGAVIFGSNATSGVINVITKSNDNNEGEIAYGSDNRRHAGLYSHFKGEQLTGNIGVHFRESDGFHAQYNNRPLLPFYPPDTPTDANYLKQQVSKSVWGKVASKQWTVNFHHFTSENDGLAAAGSTLNQSTLKYSGTLLASEYENQFGIHDLKIFADFNNFYLEIPTQSLVGVGADGTQYFEDSGENNNRARMGAHVNSRYSEVVDWQYGIEIENRATGEYQILNEDGDHVASSMEANDVNEYSLFSQIDVQQPQYRLIAGFRYTINDTVGENLLPRLSLIHPLDANQTLKFLYSTAFKSPSFVQQYINIPPNVVKGDPKLDAEMVSSSEMAYSAQYGRHLFVASIYQMSAEDFIFRSVNNDGEVVFSNTDSFTREGLDLDYRLARRQTQWYANVSWQFQGNQERDSDPTALFTPEWTFNIGASYQHNPHVNYGFSLHHVGERDVQSDLNILNVQASYKLERSFKFTASINNLLGEDILHPDIQNFESDRLIQSASKHPAFLVKIHYQF